MKERPVLFNGEMVRAILAGRKTQTRRVVKPQPVCTDSEIRFPWASFHTDGVVWTWDRDGVGGQNWNANEFPGEDKFNAALQRTEYHTPCPYGEPGDRLWVRETWQPYIEELDDDCKHFIRYQAGDVWQEMNHDSDEWFSQDQWDNFLNHEGWRSSIHMPRWASRITLEVTGVRVERLQGITEANAKAEGVTGFQNADGSIRYVDPFRELWGSINAKRGFSWKSNPWVWVVEFKTLGNSPARTAGERTRQERRSR